MRERERIEKREKSFNNRSHKNSPSLSRTSLAERSSRRSGAAYERRERMVCKWWPGWKVIKTAGRLKIYYSACNTLGGLEETTSRYSPRMTRPARVLITPVQIPKSTPYHPTRTLKVASSGLVGEYHTKHVGRSPTFYRQDFSPIKPKAFIWRASNAILAHQQAPSVLKAVLACYKPWQQGRDSGRS